MIDVSSIVSQLMATEQQPLINLQNQQSSYQSQISAYGTVQSALISFQSAMSGLTNANQFQGMTATSSNTSALTASATSTVAPGSYSIGVTTLAQAQALVAGGETSQTAAIGGNGTTTLTFDLGTISGGSLTNGVYAGASFTSNGNGTKTVTINSTNNSLQGIAAAINAANVGVTASIINDGSATPYRLSLSSNSQGASNSVKISVAGDAALSSLLAYDPGNNSGQKLTQTTAAQNASFTVNGIAVSKSSNTVTDVVPGLTLNLLQTSASPINLTIAQNTTATTTAVNTFVSAYNALHTAVSKVTAYNAATQTGAILQGDFAVNTVANQLRAMLNTSVSGAGSFTTLADIGVTFQTDGSLAVDQTKLGTAMSSNFNDIAALFDTVGQASDPQISYTSAASTAQPGNYTVNITQLATQGKLVGSSAAGTTTITAGVNDTLNVSLNGISTTATLAPGTYTAATLAAEVQTEINGTSALTAAGASVAVTQSGGIFTFTSNSYGSSSSVSITGNGASNLLGGAPVSTTGVDVAGTIGGYAATGSGQFLTAGVGNALGLKIQVNGGALGARGTINYSQGYAGTLSLWATAQDGTTGLISDVSSGLQKSITSIGTQIIAEQTRLTALQALYTSQYTALDQTLSSMNSTSQYLTTQLANLPKA